MPWNGFVRQNKTDSGQEAKRIEKLVFKGVVVHLLQESFRSRFLGMGLWPT